MAIRVFIVDDHYMVIEGIHSLLKNEAGIEWVGHASNAASCIAFLQQQSADVILMDINLPDKSGIDLCKEVKQLHPATAILGLSTFNQQSFIEKMLESGASGYLLKNATQEELMEGIQTVVHGRQYLSFDAATSLRQAPQSNSNVPLITRREKEILGLIANGLTNGEIAQQLFISTATVDTHRKNLLAKFEVKNTALLIKMAVQMQLI
ncbi:MAG: response regulator transcription factor [Chitinophagaceae bacterium]|nr:MAG: response regulator transcription factor [Chitinophagaceae bacterium]